jgi:hypothetical protein
MKTPFLSTLTLAAALAVAGVSFAKADEAPAKPAQKIDRMTTASISTDASFDTRAACEPGNDAGCKADAKAQRFPVNALEGMNLGW